MKALVDEALAESPSVEHVVVWRRLGLEDVPMQEGRDVFWDEAVAESPGKLEPLEVESEHPYLLTYTSGTTGPPKGVLHVQGGFLVSIAREVAYQADARPGDVIHFVTDMGWIMGPWEVVGGMALGCTIVFAEGAPDWPAADRLWGLVESERVTILGRLADARPRADPARRGARRAARPLVAAGARHDRGAVEPRALPLAARARRRRALSDHQLLRRDRGGRLLPLPHACRADQGVLARRPRPRDGDGRGRRRGPVGAWRGRGARLPALVARDDARASGATPSATWIRTGGDFRGSGCTATGPRWTRTATGSCTAARTTRSTSRASGSGRPSSSRPWSPTPWSRRPRRSGVPHEVKGEVAWVFCALVPGAEPSEELAAELRAQASAELGKALGPERVAVRLGVAEDAQREDRKARGEARRRWGWIRATCLRSRTRRRWTRSKPPPRARRARPAPPGRGPFGHARGLSPGVARTAAAQV